MSRHPCPICHDPSTFPIWIGDDPPPTCPNDPAWPRRSLHSTCPQKIAQGVAEAERRRITPDGFDANGVLIPSESGRVWMNYIREKGRWP